LDFAEQPRILFESTATCADSRHAEAELNEALSRARAPAPEWRVTMRIRKTASNALQADGDIIDDGGAAVGHREFTGKLKDCEGLARAVGVWASLVLDAEIRRPRPTTTSQASNDPDATVDSVNAAQSQSEQKKPAPLPDPFPQPDQEPSRRDEPATKELGIGGFVMSGIGGGSALVGASTFFDFAAGRVMLLRPSIAVGESLPGAGPQTLWAALRLDGCFRMVGQYTSRRGLQMDMCGGVDVGFLQEQSAAGQSAPYVAPGPSIDLLGELGGDLAVILRGVAGVNVVDKLADTPIFSGRGEIALAWSLP
jgi:hypothetical protein